MVSCNVYNSFRTYDEKYVDIKNTEKKIRKSIKDIILITLVIMILFLMTKILNVVIAKVEVNPTIRQKSLMSRVHFMAKYSN